LDRPITDASDDGICRWHAAKLWQTRAKLLKLFKLHIIRKEGTTIWTINFEKKMFKPYKREFSWKEVSSILIGWRLRFSRELRSLRFLRFCVEWQTPSLPGDHVRTQASHIPSGNILSGFRIFRDIAFLASV